MFVPHRNASAIFSEEDVGEEAGESAGGGRDERGEGGGRDDERDDFIDNEALGVQNPVEFQRAPADVNGYDYSRDDRADCFACKYCKRTVGATGGSDVGMWTNDGVADAYTDMCQLIDENYGTVSNRDLFEMVHEYYEKNVRTLHDYGPWSRESIANHIIFHRNSEDVHMAECTALLFAQVQSLRQKTWIKNVDTGQVEPHVKNLHLLERYVKLLDDHLVKRKTLRKT